jgi:hypothetical protein
MHAGAGEHASRIDGARVVVGRRIGEARGWERMLGSLRLGEKM